MRSTLWLPLLLVAAFTSGGAVPSQASDDTVGDLGISQLECDCTYVSRQRRWIFRATPRIVSVKADSPASGKLQDGDIILAIDGQAITSRGGGQSFARLTPGTAVELIVLREGLGKVVEITPQAIARHEALSSRAPGALLSFSDRAVAIPSAAPRPGLTSRSRAVLRPSSSKAPRAPRALIPPLGEVLPTGWFGFAMECFPCSGERIEGEEDPVWIFGKPPRIYRIQRGSPAARAGIRRGDVLTHIDGVSITVEEGGRKFGSVKPGQSVEWRVRRGRTTRTVVLDAQTHPSAWRTRRESARQLGELRGKLRRLSHLKEYQALRKELASLSADLANLKTHAPEVSLHEARILRYSGHFGPHEIVVRGVSPVVVTRSEKSGELIISSDDMVVRIRDR